MIETIPAILADEPLTIEGTLEWFNRHIKQMENGDLPFCEGYIRKAGYGFILMGQAFKVIRDKKLYRSKKFKNFEDYTEKVWGIKPWQFRHKIRASDRALKDLMDNGDKSPFLPESCWGMLARLKDDEMEDALTEIQGQIIEGKSPMNATTRVVKRKRAIRKSKTLESSSDASSAPENDSGASNEALDEEIDYSVPDNWDEVFRGTFVVELFCDEYENFIEAGCDGEDLMNRCVRVIKEMIEVNEKAES